jgi:DNA-binding NtrC family response regulator
MARDESDVFPEAPTVAQPKLADADAPSYALEIIEGPDAGARFVIDESAPSRSLVGKSPACDLRLSDPQVSRRHAALEIAGRRLAITDLGSTNGTFVDGVAVGSAFLRGGEIVRLGGTAIRVDPARAASSPPLAPVARFGRTLGASPAMRKLYPLCQRLARADVPLVIEGETGTGKEQLAESLHDESPRRDKPFVVLDCTAIAPSLIESELFGHERGAFTGSVGARKGVFERAHEGTLLIDEIGDLPLELQPKLLRAIERSTITRVGGERPVHVDVRLLAATRRDLDQEVQKGRFRDDLFHRLAVARIELPPLRARRGDVALLARHFWVQLGGAPDALPADLLRRWEDWPWPGNVRELRNAVARRLALGDLADEPPEAPASEPPAAPRGAPEAPFSFPPTHPQAAPNPAHPPSPRAGDPIARILALDLPLAEAREKLLAEFEERYVDRVLAQHGGNVTRAAAAAGVARRHLQRLKAKG